MIPALRCPSEPQSAAPSARRSAASYDVLIGGASFAGLAVARELRASGARVLVLDRYEIGERQTSACAAPTDWLRNLGLESAIRQTFGSLVCHTPRATARWPLGWTFSTFDYRLLCDAALGAARGGDGVRDREGRRPRRRGRPHRSRRRQRAADGRRARLEADPRRRPGAAAERAPLARTGGPSRRQRRGPRDLDRRARDPRRVRLVVPGARRAPRRDRLVRPARPRQGPDGAPRRANSGGRRTATRATGSRTSCGRRPRTGSSSPATRPATACR